MKNEIEKLKKELVFFGKTIFQSGLTDSHGGNISVRYNDFILIKRSGKMLGFLTENDIIVTTLEENEELDKNASIELKVHRNIYKKLPDVKAVVHSHAPYTVAISLLFSEKIIPKDSEAKFLLKEIPILETANVIGSDDVAKKLPKLLKNSKIAVIKSHGPFSTGKNLEEAFKYLSILENSCKILSILKSTE